MDILNVIIGLFLLFILAVCLYAGYKWYQRKKNAPPLETYTTYYSGFWMSGMLNYPPVNGYSPATTEKPNSKSNMTTYAAFTQCALAAGIPDTDFLISTGSGWVSSGNINKVTLSSDPTTAIPVLKLYDSTQEANFNWAIDSNGAMYNEAVTSLYQLVPTMDSVAGSITPDSSWPPRYLLLQFLKTGSWSVDNANYFDFTWSYGNTFTNVGPYAYYNPSTNISYINTISCVVKLPSTIGGTSLTSTTFYLDAGQIYYYDKYANPFALGGPALLINSYSTNQNIQWYNTINNLSFSLFWNAGSVCDYYSNTLKYGSAGGLNSVYSQGQPYSCPQCLSLNATPTQQYCTTCNYSNFGPFCEYPKPAVNPVSN